MGKKSTAQPRPQLNVPPRGIGPIEEPNENDVLCGRGGRINSHEGNVRFRDVIQRNKKEYLAPSTKKLEKAHIAKRIVDDIRNMNPPGRFLKEDASDGFWYDIGDAKALKKCGQCLREDAQGIRNEIEHEYSSGDEATPKRKAANTAPSAAPPAAAAAASRNGAYGAPAPSGFVRGNNNDGNTQHQGHNWMSGGMNRQHSAPLVYPHHPGGPQYQQNHDPPSNMYNMPSTFYSGVRSTGNKFRNMSQTATEAMRHATHHPGSGAPTNQVAFGRVFTPTVLSSGSTMSTISGLSVPSDQAAAAAPSWQRTSAELRAGSQQRTSGEFRVSQLSDMTTSMMSLGSSLGLTRSNSLPELGISREFTSLSDSSFAVLMEEEVVVPEDGATQNAVCAALMVPEHRDSSGTSGSSGIRPPPVPGAVPQRTRTTSAVSAMSLASGSSQRSNLSSSVRSSVGSESSWLNPIRSRLTGSIHSDHSLNSSTRSVYSDMSAEIHALDLAAPKVLYS